MSRAKKILEDLYKIWNPKEEAEEGLTAENRQTYNSENLRNMFIGTLMSADNGDNAYQQIRTCIDKMSDEWVLEFLKVMNGDEYERVEG